MPVLPEMPWRLPSPGSLQRRAVVNALAAVERDRVRAAEREEAAALLAPGSPDASDDAASGARAS